MNKHILLFGAGKSATVLIRFLVDACTTRRWRLTVADNDQSAAASKIGNSDCAEAVAVDIRADEARMALVRRADIVISLLPPQLHTLVARDCLEERKHLLTASYIDDGLRAMADDITAQGLLFLCEMGLDPGIDHMSAMRLMDGIRSKGGVITSFQSHCGGLVAPASDDNPWRYKISWNPRNIVTAGKQGARYLSDGIIRELRYRELFGGCRELLIPGLEPLVAYPNRDSLGYLALYKLEGIKNFIRTTIRYPEFCDAWQAIVMAGLTGESPFKDGSRPATFNDWSASIGPLVTASNRVALQFLGLFDHQSIPSHLSSAADVLQYLLERRLMMQSADRDMVIMLHQVGYLLDGQSFRADSLLVLEGEDSQLTAMAKTVGLPLGIAAVMIAEGRLAIRGLHVPVVPAIYDPVLLALEKTGIRFTETVLPAPTT